MTQYFLPVLYSLLQILLLIGTGIYLRRFAGWNKEVFSGISQLIVKVTLPALFISRMSSMNRTDLISGAIFPFYALLIMGVSLFFALILFRLYSIPRPSKNAYLALSIFGNAGYIPLALFDIFQVTIPGFSEFFNGPLLSLYIGSYLFVFTPMVWTVGNCMLTGSTGEIRLSRFLPPPAIGILTGVLLCLAGSESLVADTTLPFHYFHAALKSLGAVTSPLILIVLGSMIGDLELNRSLSREDIRFAVTPMLIRYGILPLSFLFLLKTSAFINSLAPAVLMILFIETVVPPPANFSVMTKSAGRYENETALSLLITYGAYMIILPPYMMCFFKMVQF